MKKLKYIYALFIAILFGLAVSSCEDDDYNVTEENEAANSMDSGVMVKTSFTVGISSHDISSDLDTRAINMDNANTDNDQPENGGRFKNIVIVLVDHEEKVLGVHCRNFENASGLKEYSYVFTNVSVDSLHVKNKQKYKVYAFGNVCKEHFEDIETNDTVGTKIRNNINTLKVYNHCINANISVNNAYNECMNNGFINISFKPDTTYLVNNNVVTSTGMPENNCAQAIVVKGNTQFNVQLKRVCARVKLTFRNLTGEYIDYENNKPKNNSIYIDKFIIKDFFVDKTRYFYNSAQNTQYNSFDNGMAGANGGWNFDILKALKCKVNGKVASDHINNKIENDSTLTISMYIFEHSGADQCTYDLKIDRGRSLGLNTTTIDTANAYVIWNNTKHNSIAYKDGKICASSEQNSADRIPFKEQVFWKLEIPKNPKVTNPSLPYMLQHLEIDEYDRINMTKGYFAHQNEAEWNRNDPSLVSSLTTISDYPQYIQLRLKNNTTSISYYTISLLNSKYKTYGAIAPSIPYDEGESCWGKALRIGGERYYYLTVDSNNNLCKSRSELFSGSSGLQYEWTLYAKYIIRNNQPFDIDNVGKIQRNHNYEFEFNVMPNYTDKEDLYVKCVRNQSSIDWSETQK